MVPQDIAAQLWISLKTVYNYITKYGTNIRTERRMWKTFVNFEDLQSYLQWSVQTLQNDYNPSLLKNEQSKLTDNALKQNWNLQNDYNKLQNDYNYTLEKIQQLEKMSSNFQDMAQKYAIKLSEEKDEKKALQEKYDSLEKNFLDKVNDYSSLQVKSVRNLYLSYWFSIFLLCFLLFLIVLYINKVYLF